MKNEGSEKTKREDKENFVGCTVYMPIALSDEIGVMARSQGLTKAAFLIKAAKTQILVDKGEYVTPDGGEAFKEFRVIEDKIDNLSTDLKLLKMLLAK